MPSALAPGASRPRRAPRPRRPSWRQAGRRSRPWRRCRRTATRGAARCRPCRPSPIPRARPAASRTTRRALSRARGPGGRVPDRPRPATAGRPCSGPRSGGRGGAASAQEPVVERRVGVLLRVGDPGDDVELRGRTASTCARWLRLDRVEVRQVEDDHASRSASHASGADRRRDDPGAARTSSADRVCRTQRDGRPGRRPAGPGLADDLPPSALRSWTCRPRSRRRGRRRTRPAAIPSRSRRLVRDGLGPRRRPARWPAPPRSPSPEERSIPPSAPDGSRLAVSACSACAAVRHGRRRLRPAARPAAGSHLRARAGWFGWSARTVDARHREAGPRGPRSPAPSGTRPRTWRAPRGMPRRWPRRGASAPARSSRRAPPRRTAPPGASG